MRVTHLKVIRGMIRALLPFGHTKKQSYLPQISACLHGHRHGKDYSFQRFCRLRQAGLVMNEFGCGTCGSPAAIYPQVLEEDAPVTCARCAVKICSYGEFRRRLEQTIHLTTESAGVTGC